MSPFTDFFNAVVESLPPITWRSKRSNQLVRDRLNGALRAAVELGVRFEVGDFESALRPCWWLTGDTLEDMYGLGATGERNRKSTPRNMSAVRALESYWGRKPFILDRKRLYVGRSLRWAGHDVTVTSFNDKAGTVTLCAYRDRSPNDYSPRKIERRFTLTNADVRAEERRRKEVAR